MSRSLKTVAGLAAAGAVGWWAWQQWRRSQHSFQGQTVVITGGSRGLGLELARVFCEEGANVAICGRNGDTIEEALDILRSETDAAVFGAICDVTNEREVHDFIKDVSDVFGPVDVLVNNAGVIQVGPQACMTREDYKSALDTHFFGPLATITAVLPEMRERRSGRIVNISSIGGKLSVPHLLPYCTSKFALVGYSHGLTTELQQHGISVTTVTPGLMRTGSPRNADFKGDHEAEYALFSISAALPILSIDSRTAAERIVEGCRRKAADVCVSYPSAIATRMHAVAPDLSVSLISWINHLLPQPTADGMTSRKGVESESQWSPSWLTALNEEAAVRNNEIQSG